MAAVYSALKRQSVQAGLVILGDLSIQGNIKPVRSLTVYGLLRNHAGRAWFDDFEVEELDPRDGAVCAATFHGDVLVLETKGQDTEQDKVKRRYLEEWTQAVNAHGGFGQWRSAVAKTPGEIRDILMQQDASVRAGG